ncbi:MAG: Ycf48-like protein [Bacteroidetes bacterium ADurb.BinA395]|nr:MAG: Ycf48-like protein [Bacteroidetes bacterium ADurb.BinA395]
MKKTILLLTFAAFGMAAMAQNIAIGKNNTLITSSDGGDTWVSKSPTNSSGYNVVGISKYSTNNWVISQFKSGTGNYIQRTTDGGDNYTVLKTNLNGSTNYQKEMAHFGADTLLLLSYLLTDNAVGSHSYSALTTGTPPLTFANGGTERAPHIGLTKINSKSALVINNQTNGMPTSSSSEVYKYETKSVTAGSYCFTTTRTIYEHPQLSGAARVDANTLFAVGNVNGASYSSASLAGYLYKSTDNGATWSVVTLPSIPANCGLMSVAVSPNGQNLVVAGTKNYVAYSSDGGSTWAASTLTGVPGTVTNWVYTKIAFADNNTVIVGGSDQSSTSGADWYALRSTNGGANFTAITTLTDNTYTDTSTSVDRRGSYMSLYFASSTVGYAVMGRGNGNKIYEIMKTTNGGATWSLVTWETGAKPNVNSVEIINHLSNENDLVVNSLVGKNLWEIDITTLPVPAASVVSKYTAKDLRGAYKKSATELYAIEYATNANEGGIYKSTDGGLSWTLATSALNGQPMIVIIDGFVGGYLGRAYTANADFSTLTRTAVLGHYGGNLIDLSSTYKGLPNTSSSTIYAIGEAGGIFKSTNTGATFTYIGKPEWSDDTYTAINAVDENTAYICGYNSSNKGIILKTTNGGTDWTKLEFINIGKLNDIEMYNATQGLAVGDGGVLIGTVNGEAWISKSLGITDDLVKVVCDESVSMSGTPLVLTGMKNAHKTGSFVYLKNNQLNIVSVKGAQVNVYNILGVKEHSEILNSDHSVVNLSRGAKIVQIECDGTIYTTKVVIR